MNLGKLEVKSFVTKMEEGTAQTLKGGTSGISNVIVICGGPKTLGGRTCHRP